MSHIARMTEWCESSIWWHIVSHTYDDTLWVIYMMNESCHISRIKLQLSTDISTSCTYQRVVWVTYQWVTSHVSMSPITRMNESCHAYEWVMSRVWTHHVTRMNESCHTYEWVMSYIYARVSKSMVDCCCSSPYSCTACAWVKSHVWTSHVTRMNESCHTYEWVMSHAWTSHVTRMNESCHTHERVMSHVCMSPVTYTNNTCHTYG